MYTTETITATIPVTEYIGQYRDAEKFIEFCKVCHNYGRCWACPPYDFDPIEQIAGYQTFYVIGTKITLTEPIRCTPRTTQENQALSRKILADVRKPLDNRLLTFEAKHPGSRAFFAGTCFACPNGACTRIEGKPCIQPEQVRPALEAFGFDIGKTASELLGIELQWSDDGSLPEYFTLVSGLLTHDTETPLIF